MEKRLVMAQTSDQLSSGDDKVAIKLICVRQDVNEQRIFYLSEICIFANELAALQKAEDVSNKS